MRILSHVCVLTLGLLGCRGPTQVLVQVDADEPVWQALESLTISVWSHDADSNESEVFMQVVAVDENTTRPFRLPLAPRGRDASRRYRVEVVGNLRDEQTVTARLISGYVSRRSLEYLLVLDAACIDVRDCTDEQTCVAGECESAEVPPDELCELGECPDTGRPDSGARDAQIDSAIDAPSDMGEDAPQDANSGVDAGDGGTLGGFVYLKSDAPIEDGLFGTSVALDADANTLAVGAPTRGPGGTVEIFNRVGENWRPVYVVRDTVARGFGTSVALSPDGTILIIGAPGDAGGLSDAGTAFEYQLVAGNWIPGRAFVSPDPQENALVGTSVAVSDPVPENDGQPVAIIGAPGYRSAFSNQGAVLVWTADSITAESLVSNANARFGTSVAITADGGEFAAGAPFTTTMASGTQPGRVYRHAITFDLGNTVLGSLPTLEPSELAPGTSGFGFAVDYSAEGDLLVGSSSGAVARFDFSPMRMVDTLSSFVIPPGSERDGLARDVAFGPGIAVSGASNDPSAIMGDLSDEGAPSSGAVFIWSTPPAGAGEPEHVKAPNLDNFDLFGTSVAARAGWVAVGASNEDSESAANPDNNSVENAGAVYVFRVP